MIRGRDPEYHTDRRADSMAELCEQFWADTARSRCMSTIFDAFVRAVEVGAARTPTTATSRTTRARCASSGR